MADVLYLLLIAAFFGLAALFVKACEALVGPDEAAPPEDVGATEREPLAA